MYIFASFEQGALLEIALSDLTRLGLAPDRLMAVPLQKTTRQLAIFDKIYRADGFSILDGAALSAAVGMSLGVIFGSQLYWGPIIWGLIGFILGALIGLGLDWYITTRFNRPDNRTNPVPVIVIIRCEISESAMIEKILRRHQALGLAKFRPEQAAQSNTASANSPPP